MVIQLYRLRISLKVCCAPIAAADLNASSPSTTLPVPIHLYSRI